MRVLNHTVLFLSLLLLSVICCSCSLKSLFKTDSSSNSFAYDLAIPQAKTLTGIHINVKPFLGNSRSKMATRAGNRIEFSEKNHWIQPPETILTRYLTLAFASQSENAKSVCYTVSGHLLSCAFDSDLGKFRMQIQYTITKQQDSKFEFSAVKEYKIEMEQNTAEAQAKAFTLCADDFANDIIYFARQHSAN